MDEKKNLLGVWYHKTTDHTVVVNKVQTVHGSGGQLYEFWMTGYSQNGWWIDEHDLKREFVQNSIGAEVISNEN